MDDVTQDAVDQSRSLIHGALERGARLRREQDFRELDRRELAAMDDKHLAEWQSHYPHDSAQYVLAEHEWQRRLTQQQIAASRRNTYIAAACGLIGGLLGVVLGWLLSSWHPLH